jgi:hypothetical protein
MNKKKNRKLTLHRETLVKLREPNLELVAGGATLRCDTTYYASCGTCDATNCSDPCSEYRF